MNALANSQYGELKKFLRYGYPDGKGPVTFARYTGQESDEERNLIIAKPPDILLTNYVMMELILTRPIEQGLIHGAQGLKFLVLDELHTYRGRQGADVALLVRRIRDRMSATQLQCVGTSATIAGSGTYDQRMAEVAVVASQLFGDQVKANHVIGETLRRATPETVSNDAGFTTRLTARVREKAYKANGDYRSFLDDPLSCWIESTFGVTKEPDGNRLTRAKPLSVESAAQNLSGITNLRAEDCAEAIQNALLAGYKVAPNPDTGFPPFAFRLHQFIAEETRFMPQLSPKVRAT